MKIYLLDINSKMTDAWLKVFKDEPNVEVINEDFKVFMDNHQNVDAIVSPANSFGLMDGGYDRAIIKYFGKKLMKDVQEAILNRYWGEQPVGTSISIPTGTKIVNDDFSWNFQLLIHTPTMTAPEKIVDPRIIYQCMRTTLIEAIEQEVESIVIPAFGGATGQVDFNTIAKMMWLGYKQVMNSPEKIYWKYALETQQKLLTAMIQKV